jgi:hypothetical protein
METSAGIETTIAAEPPRRKRRVRNFLLDTPLQLRLASYLIAVAAALSGALGWLLWSAWSETSRVVALADPLLGERLGRVLAHEDRVRMLWIAAALVLLLLVLLGGAVVVTHRIAGPAFAIGRTCRQVARGTLTRPRPLRAGDMLLDLADDVGGMVEALRIREERERALLLEVAAKLRGRAGVPEEREGAIGELEALAAEKARRLGP